jgi:hypothetical protein
MTSVRSWVVRHLSETKEAVVSPKDVHPTSPIGAHDRLNDMPIHATSLSKFQNEALRLPEKLFVQNALLQKNSYDCTKTQPNFWVIVQSPLRGRDGAASRSDSVRRPSESVRHPHDSA